ncbi:MULTISPECIES: dTDP-4-dehydrorhamnose reductase [Campylobacter]|uniref:dTDP-4-dehydrorhamnose reductase n=1 Tax=Campylobacter porcelli TaxID=1660073 RepID=A0A1X9SY55_9BACT|nr:MULTISPECIES: dTDP-4-dehydrorhamnose reductase [unclassified Campylobacter]ARR01143.1 dTDP-4-dehydrorhamnose reductase [Campylobacter sp. RM6137]MCR8697107.1 dTDP-4-dehydrorhamnose reductase [Campylobacter sp. RM19073]MEE3705530.1 dTDP-4-dehydrorhamnose reductase [Campylobacter sp. CX2-8023-23]MEE3745239.1 dTDP-4-dehydrorhamnose reductase [Campylobacter sp. CX2-4855-23]
MERILVFGAYGQLGSEFRYLSNRYSNFSFMFLGKNDIDIINFNETKEFIKSKSFTVIINCAAYTNVDKAEEEFEYAKLVNYKAVENLGKIAHDNNIKFIHISTDYVFNGNHCSPYCEFDQAFPINKYGLSKLMGEQILINMQIKKCIIIRTSWLYGYYGKNFVYTILNAIKANNPLSVVSDQIGTPTNSRDLATTILNIVPLINNDKPQIYHYSNEGVASWYDFANAITSISKIKCQIFPIESKDYPTIAVRPLYSVLNKSKIKQDFGVAIPYWRDSLVEFIKSIKEL